MGGLTLDIINQKGGVNVNKYLAYLALTNSATDMWDDFDITKTIVVPDFETKVNGEVDLIDDESFTIERKFMDIPITHTDGCGMILPSLSIKNFMVRLPWVKGLLGVFDFKQFIIENNASPIITDIYGCTHNILDEDIQIIFTESQFKMNKYYDSWKQYQEYFIQYNCSAGKCTIEEDKIPNAKINYQMLQTLTAIKPEEFNRVVRNSTEKLSQITSSVKSMLNVFGATEYNEHKTSLQKSLLLYPELLNDIYTKQTITQIKKSLIKSYKGGKLEIAGKFTFLIPDLYAFCEKLFLGIEIPKGLLQDKEVYCRLYEKSDKVDCLRSPHLYKEHSVRNLIVNDKIKKWFQTDAIYTSTHDLISKILQFDNDGDKSLVVADPLFISIAERSMKDVVPLYYNMRKAAPTIINQESIFKGLNAAYIGGNIGSISNDITKIWNSDFWYADDADSLKKQEEALKVVKYLCMENNFTIDYAKTLYKPKRPPEISSLIKKYTKAKVPFFFQYAKDKINDKVAKKNNSFVNRLDSLIKNKKLSYKLSEFGKIDYKMLMSNPDIKIDDKLIHSYKKLNNTYHYKINMEDKYSSNFSYIAKQIMDKLSEFKYSNVEITDMLVKHLYHNVNSKCKEVLWFCYGDIIYDNISKNISDFDSICVKCGKRFKKVFGNQEYCLDCGHTYQPKMTKTITCIDCGKEVIVNAWDMKTIRCEECQNNKNKIDTRERVRKYRIKNKM